MADTTDMVSRGGGNRVATPHGRQLPRTEDGLPQTTELRLAERALRDRWPITQEIREDVVRRAHQVLAYGDASVGQIIAAGRLLALADSLNVKREANAVREATPATQINIFGDVSAYAGVFGESAPNPNENAIVAPAKPSLDVSPAQPDQSTPVPPQP